MRITTATFFFATETKVLVPRYGFITVAPSYDAQAVLAAFASSRMVEIIPFSMGQSKPFCMAKQAEHFLF